MVVRVQDEKETAASGLLSRQASDFMAGAILRAGPSVPCGRQQIDGGTDTRSGSQWPDESGRRRMINRNYSLEGHSKPRQSSSSFVASRI